MTGSAFGHPASSESRSSGLHATLLIRPGFTEKLALGQLNGRSSVAGSGLNRRTAFGGDGEISAKGSVDIGPTSTLPPVFASSR